MPPPITVDRCVCLSRTFAELRERAAREGLSLDDVMALPAAGRPDARRCGTCLPYLRRCFETGQTVFHELLPPEPEAGLGTAPGGSDAVGRPRRDG